MSIPKRVAPPPGGGAGQASSASKVAFATWMMDKEPRLDADGPLIQLARAELRNGGVLVRPERSDMPEFQLPNNLMGAAGFRPGWFTHDYLVVTPAPAALRGPSGLALVGDALVADPTPGQDGPPSATGTRNDVGHLVYFDGGDNFVRTYTFPPPKPYRSRAVVNYTIKGEHAMDEGFVLRFAQLNRGGGIILVTYGEGNAIKQSWITSLRWRGEVRRVWTENAEAIFRAALAGARR